MANQCECNPCRCQPTCGCKAKTAPQVCRCGPGCKCGDSCSCKA